MDWDEFGFGDNDSQEESTCSTKPTKRRKREPVSPEISDDIPDQVSPEISDDIPDHSHLLLPESWGAHEFDLPDYQNVYDNYRPESPALPPPPDSTVSTHSPPP
eukprot:707301_1